MSDFSKKPIRRAIGRTWGKVGYLFIEYADGTCELRHLDYRKPKKGAAR